MNQKGYIGSHTVFDLLIHGHNVVVVDNLCNAKRDALRRCEYLAQQHVRQVGVIGDAQSDDITGLSFGNEGEGDLGDERRTDASPRLAGGNPKVGKIQFIHMDILDKEACQHVFETYRGIWAVLHFAGLKSVSESWAEPALYYRTNVTGTLNVLECIVAHPRCSYLVYSSSACVYGEDPESTTTVSQGKTRRLGDDCESPPPVKEDAPLNPQSPYGQTKATVEKMITQFCQRYDGSNGKVLSAAILRYFNPVGAHPSGLLGEDPGPDTTTGNNEEVPSSTWEIHQSDSLCARPQKLNPTANAKKYSNLMPIVCQVASGQLPYLNVYGGNWPTRDGSGCRDYIHVMDLARGHLLALRRLVETMGEGNGWNQSASLIETGGFCGMSEDERWGESIKIPGKKKGGDEGLEGRPVLNSIKPVSSSVSSIAPAAELSTPRPREQQSTWQDDDDMSLFPTITDPSSIPWNCVIYNLGTGQNVTVLEMIRAMELVSGRRVPYKVVDRRPGDIGCIYANVEKAKYELGWFPEK
ncbi:hypothetical protein HK102_009504, partial [Quaeritorhiza haematococci]